MSEYIPNHTDRNEAATDVTEAAYEAFEHCLMDLSEQVPDLLQVEGLQEEAQHIIGEFGINSSLFDTEERTLVFSGIVAKYLRATAEQSKDTSEDSRSLMVNMLTVLAHDHSDTLGAEFDHDEVHSHELDEDNNLRAYDAYTDRNLTNELKSAIETRGLLDAVKQRLGVDPDTEDAYDIRVLSVALTDTPTHGLAVDNRELNANFSLDLLDEVNREREQVENWKEGLKARGQELAKRLGRTEMTADAWVTIIDGKKTICLSSPFAEKIVTPEITDNVSYYSDDDRARDMAVLEHEYAHTQGGSNIDHDIIGINIEELRAETFSNNKLGYNDMKGFFSDYGMFTGHDIREELRSKPKGGTNAELYASIANTIGADSMVDVLFALPKSYAESDQASTFLRDIARSTGGYDGVLASILEKQIQKGDTEVEKRIAKASERIAAIVNKPGSTMNIDSFVMMRERQGLSVGAELIRDYIAEHYPAAS